MPLFINDKQVTIDEIRAFNLNGPEDKVMSMFKQNLSYLIRRFEKSEGSTGFITLKWSPGVRKYNKTSKRTEGKKAVWDTFMSTMNTPQGTKIIRYCEQAIPLPGGGYKYLPRGNWFKSAEIYGENDVEYLLFKITFANTLRMEMEEGEIIHPNAPITVEDINLEQRRIATDRTESSELHAYIYSALSPLKDSPDTIRSLAAAWGVNKADVKPLHQVKNSLYDKVLTAEKSNNPRYNIKAFIGAVQEDNEFFEKLVLIQKALDFKVLYFDGHGKRWCYIDHETHDIDEIVIIPGTMMRQKNEFLADHFMTHRKDFRQLEKTVHEKIKEKEGRQTSRVNEDDDGAKFHDDGISKEDLKKFDENEFDPDNPKDYPDGTDFVEMFENKKITYPELKSLMANRGGKSVGVKAISLARSLTKMYDVPE